MQFLYMARRDKYTVEVISTFRQNKTNVFQRNLQIKNINLNEIQKFKLEQIYAPQRLDWELVVETADTYAELRKRLLLRGYKHIPSSHKELLSKPDVPFLDKKN